jgi:hypothetical protein
MKFVLSDNATNSKSIMNLNISTELKILRLYITKIENYIFSLKIWLDYYYQVI